MSFHIYVKLPEGILWFTSSFKWNSKWLNFDGLSWFIQWFTTTRVSDTELLIRMLYCMLNPLVIYRTDTNGFANLKMPIVESDFCEIKHGGS